MAIIWILPWQHDWYMLRIAAAGTIAVSIISTIGRLSSRRMKRRAFLPDDWLIVAALVVAVSASAMNIWLSIDIDSNGSFEYQGTLVQICAFATQIHWIVAIGLTTHSYIAFLWRYFTDAPQGRKLLWCHLLVGLWAFGSILGVIFGLGLPVSRYWTEEPGPRYWARLICTTVLHIFIDIAILGIPIPWIKRLAMPRLYRNLVFGIFFLGLLTMAATCVRFAYLLKRYNAGTEHRIEYAIFAVMWMLIEVNTAICVANLPSLGPALLWFPRRISDTYNRLSVSITQKRDEERIGPFDDQIVPKSPTPESISRSSTPQLISRSPTPQLIARRSTPQLPSTSPIQELSATPRYGPVHDQMMELPNNEGRELEYSASAHTDAV